MKFISFNGYSFDDNQEETSYLSFTVSGGNNNNSIGDQAWFSNDGTKMELLEYADNDVFQEVLEMFERDSQMAFKGALRHIGLKVNDIFE